jgi:regulator of cell morphogenesis and NO signaling
MNIAEHKTVGEIVAEDYRWAEIFKKYGIDFCCGGKKPLLAVCEEKQIDPQQLIENYRALSREGGALSTHNFAEWEADFLADYIVNVHHKYVSENIPLLYEFTQKVARVHGGAHPELLEIAGLFEAVAQEMTMHMRKEELILFPYIKRLVAADKGQLTLEAPHFGTVENPIRMMEEEHDRAGNLMKQIRQLSGDYTPPANACNTYRVTFRKLQEFEEDLHQHVHLENNILFPRAAALEARLRNS